MFRDGKLTSAFSLFLFGIVKQGFYKADLPFEWWSYTTLVLVVIGAFSGSVGYKLLGRGENRQELIITEVAVTASGCLFYLVSLSYSLATSVNMYNSYWMTSDRTFVLATLQALGFRFVNMLNLWVFEFLSAGFFLAVISTILSSIVLYRLRKTPSASIHDNNARMRS